MLLQWLRITELRFGDWFPASNERITTPSVAKTKPSKTFHVAGSCRKNIPSIAVKDGYIDVMPTIRFISSAKAKHSVKHPTPAPPKKELITINQWSNRNGTQFERSFKSVTLIANAAMTKALQFPKAYYDCVCGKWSNDISCADWSWVINPMPHPKKVTAQKDYSRVEIASESAELLIVTTPEYRNRQVIEQINPSNIFLLIHFW